jgi:hypothetical protein
MPMIGREGSNLREPFRTDILIEVGVDVVDDAIYPDLIRFLCLQLRHCLKTSTSVPRRCFTRAADKSCDLSPRPRKRRNDRSITP